MNALLSDLESGARQIMEAGGGKVRAAMRVETTIHPKGQIETDYVAIYGNPAQFDSEIVMRQTLAEAVGAVVALVAQSNRADQRKLASIQQQAKELGYELTPVKEEKP